MALKDKNRRDFVRHFPILPDRLFSRYVLVSMLHKPTDRETKIPANYEKRTMGWFAKSYDLTLRDVQTIKRFRNK